MHLGSTHTPGHTFATEKQAAAWLRREQVLIDEDRWTSPAQRRSAEEAESLTFGQYADQWLSERQVSGRPLKPRTVELYQSLFDRWMTGLWDHPIGKLTRTQCTDWYKSLDASAKTMRAHAYPWHDPSSDQPSRMVSSRRTRVRHAETSLPARYRGQ